MTAAGPWSVKGIDPKAREIAKDLARRSGMTLGDWLNQMIIEGGEAEPSPPPLPSTPPPSRRALDDLYREAQAAYRAPTRSPVSEGEAMRATRALESLASRVEAGEHRTTLAISGIDQSMLGVLSRLDDLDREHLATGARLSNLLGEVRSAQEAIAERLRRAGEDGASAATLEALQEGLAKLAARMDVAAAKAEAGQNEVEAAGERLSRRIDRVETVLEAAPAAYADAEKVETVLTRMAERLDHNDTKTDAALQSLQASFANLDARLRSGEARMAHVGGQDLERRFHTLAQELTQRVDATRAELTHRLRSVADGRLDAVETNLRELGGQVELAEKRSAQAIDRIGREVMRVAHSLGERVGATERTGAEIASRAEARLTELEARAEQRMAEMETRSAHAAEAMAGEMSRVADAMEARLRDADSSQAQALEKLGGEIERIAERLAERIATADRRQAEAMDDVTDKVTRIGARIDERQDQASGEFAERIRASEARTAQLLDEARSRLPRTPAEAHAPDPFVAPPPPMEAASQAVEPEPITVHGAADPAAEGEVLSNADPFAFAEPEIEAADPAWRPEGEPFSQPEAVAVSAPATSSGWHAEVDPFADREGVGGSSLFDPDDEFTPAVARGSAEPVFSPALFEEIPSREGPASPASEADADADLFEPAFSGFSVSDFAPAAEPGPEPDPRPEQLSTRQMLEAARQAARRAASGKGGEADGSVPAPRPEAKAPRPFGITFLGRRKKESAPTLRTFVLASGIAGSLTAMGVGAYLMGGAGHEGAPALSSEVAANGALGDGGAAALAPSAAPSAAVALVSPAASVGAKSVAPASSPPPAAPPHAARLDAAPERSSAPPAAKATPAQLYATAVGRLGSGDLSGLADLRAAAERGLPAAQFYLARLYDQGGAGLAKDPAEARRWTQRAAEAGDPSAMYNLASYFYAGDGGAKDPAKAADWFRKAAERGVVNGQYNLAQLYEKGYGVPQSDAEAYKWYLVAAGSGDNDSRLAAAALKPKLSPVVQTTAENGAASLRAGLEDGMRTADAAPRPQ